MIEQLEKYGARWTYDQCKSFLAIYRTLEKSHKELIDNYTMMKAERDNLTGLL